MTNKQYILAGSGKGLIIFSKQNGNWTIDRDKFLGMPASLVYMDPRNGAWWVSLAHKHWGHKIQRSKDKGESWESIHVPQYPSGCEVRPGKPATIKYIWALEHGGFDRPDRFFIGTEPGGLFLSNDSGKHFQLVRSLWDHPSRRKDWFGGGRDEAGIHSVIVDPRNSRHFYVGVSCGGVFETTDDGMSWHARNLGLKAFYLPDPHVEVGHDPHRMLICKNSPDVIWQQNHCGVYRTIDGGKQWNDVTSKDEIGRYGFALAIDDANPDVAWIIPATSDDMRVAVNKSLFVCKTGDGGNTWQTFRSGLPQHYCYDIVLRHALAKSGDTLVFGTNGGSIFISEDAGENWKSLGRHFPKIFSMCFG